MPQLPPGPSYPPSTLLKNLKYWPNKRTNHELIQENRLISKLKGLPKKFRLQKFNLNSFKHKK